MSTWYTVVGFGGKETAAASGGVYKTRDEAQARIYRITLQCSMRNDGTSTADNRVYGYATREAARYGDISDDIGRHGRVE